MEFPSFLKRNIPVYAFCLSIYLSKDAGCFYLLAIVKVRFSFNSMPTSWTNKGSFNMHSQWPERQSNSPYDWIYTFSLLWIAWPYPLIFLPPFFPSCSFLSSFLPTGLIKFQVLILSQLYLLQNLLPIGVLCYTEVSHLIQKNPSVISFMVWAFVVLFQKLLPTLRSWRYSFFF